ncbi:MAG: UDP-glucose 4-epimerase [Solirubrobacterales bacterium]|nr:UDP-glucose 4-epimerase [Solirubrobacterales bacterium]
MAEGAAPDSEAICLVIGGGLIGSHTATELLERGHPVTVYSRSFSNGLEDAPERGSGLELVSGEIADARLDGLVAAAEIVFLLAGSSTPALSDRDPVASVSGSLEPGLIVLEAARRGSTKRVVLASSGGTVYGNVDQVPTPEDAPLRPISVHGVNSLALEGYAAMYARKHGLEPIVLRYSNVYGPGQRSRHGQGVIAAWLDALSRDRPIELIGEDAVQRDFVFADDAARATADAALLAERPGTYNVGGETHSLAEVLELIESASGRRLEVQRSPGREVDVPVTGLDCSRLLGQTGWQPAVSLPDGIARTWAAVQRAEQSAAQGLS